PCKIFWLVGDETVFVIDKAHSFDSKRGCDNWHAKSHTLIDIAFYTGAKTQRRNGYFTLWKKGRTSVCNLVTMILSVARTTTSGGAFSSTMSHLASHSYSLTCDTIYI